MDFANDEDFYAVIPAGGSGTRLWPLSRSQEPKFLLDLLGRGQSLLVDTIQRLKNFPDEEKILVVTGAAHEESVRRQAPAIPEKNILIEPSPKNSGPAVGFAAYVLNLVNPDAVLGCFAADHVIQEGAAFDEVVSKAIEAASGGNLVAVGLQPDEPSSAFGYIKKGLTSSFEGVFEVKDFVEKPSFRDAQGFISSGNYLWNAGIFVGKVSSIVEAFGEFAPEIGRLMERIAESYVSGDDFGEIWADLPSIAFDYAVAEPAARAGKFLVVPGSFDWRDLGDFVSLAGAKSEELSSDVVVVGDANKVFSQDSAGIIVTTSGRIVSVMGMKDVVVVDTPDALMITSKDHAQEVKLIVESLRDQGFDNVL